MQYSTGDSVKEWLNFGSRGMGSVLDAEYISNLASIWGVRFNALPLTSGQKMRIGWHGCGVVLVYNFVL
jgi:hypothetical protein